MKRFLRWTPVVGGVVLGAGLLAATPALAAQLSPGQTVTMEATAYGPSAQDNYPYGATDYFGQPLTEGDVAVDPNVIPLRTCLYVTGYNSANLPVGGFIGEADDEGDAIQGDHIDIFMNAPEWQVNNFGIQYVRVTVLGPASRNPSLSGTAACQAYQ
jgi:3D (Asp-Asp-Asp) domain-containing protein